MRGAVQELRCRSVSMNRKGSRGVRLSLSESAPTVDVQAPTEGAESHLSKLAARKRTYARMSSLRLLELMSPIVPVRLQPWLPLETLRPARSPKWQRTRFRRAASHYHRMGRTSDCDRASL